METANEPPPTAQEVTSGWVGVAALQCQLRELFASQALHRAAAAAMQQIGTLLDAEYTVVHARFGTQVLSEEWSREQFNLGETLREQVNLAMIDAAAGDRARCVRLGGEYAGHAVVAAVLYGDGAEQAGSAGFVFVDCDRAHAYELLVQVETLTGFVALLMSERARRATAGATGLASGNASEPRRLLLQLAGEIHARHALDQVAVGVVDGDDVRVELVNTESDLRQSNPGVSAIRGAMAECLDQRTQITLGTDADHGEFRLHAQWLEQRGGGAVATIPLASEGRIVAILAVATADRAALRPERLASITTELQGYAALLPVALQATRSLWRHARDAVAARWQRLRAHRHRTLATALSLTLAGGWFCFGTLSYHITVPATVRAADRIVVSCPRDGMLADLFVRPGDQVRAGQLLAELDSNDDALTKAELDAQLVTLEARLDQALGEGDSGKLRVLEAERNGLLAQVAVVALRIDQAHIRAPRSGVVLAGELREKLGARLAMGDALFEVARFDTTRIELHVPEQVVLDARQAQHATFLPAAAPDTEYALTGLRLSPASSVVDGKNVFLGEAEAGVSMAGLPPGMEGFAVLDAGRKPAWWLSCHRLLDWLQLSFWV